MILVNRPTITPDFGMITFRLFLSLRNIVTIEAQRLKLSFPELPIITTMWLDMIGQL
jgi:hypothetical protein